MSPENPIGSLHWYGFLLIYCIVCWSFACLCLGMIVSVLLGCFLLSTGHLRNRRRKRTQQGDTFILPSSRPSTQQDDSLSRTSPRSNPWAKPLDKWERGCFEPNRIAGHIHHKAYEPMFKTTLFESWFVNNFFRNRQFYPGISFHK